MSFCKVNVLCRLLSNKITVVSISNLNKTFNSMVLSCNLHTTGRQCNLMDFFDHKDHWGESKIKVGRPWKTDELRLKSNTDLHKLWYVLLKERNMLMTMEAEYVRQCELFPSPERLEKVEESMENLLDIVNERDQAYNLLETGETGEPGKRYIFNVLGEGQWHSNKEHFMPMHAYPGWKAKSDLPSTNKFKWALKFKKLYREKLQSQRNWRDMARSKREKELKEMYPNNVDESERKN